MFDIARYSDTEYTTIVQAIRFFSHKQKFKLVRELQDKGFKVSVDGNTVIGVRF